MHGRGKAGNGVTTTAPASYPTLCLRLVAQIVFGILPHYALDDAAEGCPSDRASSISVASETSAVPR